MDITASNSTFFHHRGSHGGRLVVVRKWAALIASLVAVWAFAFLFAPWLQQHVSPLQTLGRFVRDTGIEASALYYTEVAETSEAELVLRSTFEYSFNQ